MSRIRGGASAPQFRLTPAVYEKGGSSWAVDSTLRERLVYHRLSAFVL
jgi:hypothetical protein